MKRITRTPRVPGEVKPSDLWRTPPDLFRALDEEFRFIVDLAADDTNRLCHLWLGACAHGYQAASLETSWATMGPAGYLNPPYSSGLIGPFLRKAVEASVEGMTVVALIPNTPDTKWWQESVMQAQEIRDIPHRLKFGRPNGLPATHAMFPSAVAVFRPQPGVTQGSPRRVVWTYPRDGRR